MSKPIMLDTTIPFSGFYESIHSHNLDQLVQGLAEDDRGELAELFDEDGEEFCLSDHVDWSILMGAYAKLYTENFAAYVQGSARVDLQLQFDELTSPREYNFQTNRIFAKIPVSVARELYRLADKKKLNALIQRKFTSCDGFISSYENSLVAWRSETGDVSKWDHNQVGTLLESFISTHDDWDLYLMDDSGELPIWDALDADAVRIINAYDNLRRRSEWFKRHQLSFPFFDNWRGFLLA